MKQFGKKSLSHKLKILLDILWFGIWSVIILSILYVISVSSISLYKEGDFSILSKVIGYFTNVEKYWNYLIIHFIRLLFFIQIVKYLRKIFTNLSNNYIFIDKNIIHVKKISLIVLLSSFLGSGALTIHIPTLFYGVIIYILSEIFKIGSNLKKENDLTI